jgi:putative effector of murein hydrolase LrgA (UPF0299 family)
MAGIGRANSSPLAISDAFSQHVGLLFIPAAVGVILFIKRNRQASDIALSQKAYS